MTHEFQFHGNYAKIKPNKSQKVVPEKFTLQRHSKFVETTIRFRRINNACKVIHNQRKFI